MKIRCLKIEQPIGDYYIAVIKSSVLEKVCYTKAAKFESGKISGGQRSTNSKSLNEIKHFVQTENAAIPNSIILAANFTETDELVSDPDQVWSIEEEDGGLFLNIPDEELKICSVVDGQHRLKGVFESGKDIQLPCSVFLELPPTLQALVFATINFNQKPVDKSLAYQLFGYQLDDSKSSLWTPDILAVQLSRIFNSEGPFRDKIRLIKYSGRVSSSEWSISSAAFIGGVSTLISSNLNKDKYAMNKKTFTGVAGRKALSSNERIPLREYYIQGNDKAIRLVLERFFAAMSSYLWGGRNDDDIVFKAVGIAAQFRFLRDILLQNNDWVRDEEYFDKKLNVLNDLDFNSEYFQPRTATTVRVVDVFKLKVGMIQPDGLDGEVLTAAKVVT